jgi:hypothetical protein
LAPPTTEVGRRTIAHLSRDCDALDRLDIAGTKQMTWVARILVGLVAAFFLVWGLRFYFSPDAMAAEFSIAPSGVPGVSTVRGDLGGMFIGVGLLAASGLRRGSHRLLYSAATIIGAVAFGRVVGFAFEGTPVTTIVPFVAELVFVAILLFGAVRLRAESRP